MITDLYYDNPEDREENAVGRAAFILTLRENAITNTDLLRAMELVPREMFAPFRYRDLARSDIALPLPCGQTMTSPLIVAQMLHTLKPQAGLSVLEVGTGSGYVSALLAQLGCHVTTFERHAGLKDMAEAAVSAAGLSEKIDFQFGDGLVRRLRGISYDRILLNGALPVIPETMLALLKKPGSRLVGALSTEKLPELIMYECDHDKMLHHEQGVAVRLTKLVNG